MATASSRRLNAPVPWQALAGPLRPRERKQLQRLVRRLLAWQRTLGRWPTLGGVPDATPFVSLYAAGRLRGCFGSFEGGAGERLGRAFLQAVSDPRYGGVLPAERRDLAAQVSYLRALRPAKSVEEALARFEPGTHGLAMTREGGAPVILVPQVARDGGLSTKAMMDVLAKKATIPFEKLSRTRLFTFETEDVVARARGEGALEADRSWSSVDRAAAWLARLVTADGRVRFGIDLRSRKIHATGPMHHGRAAVVLRALAAHGGHTAALARGRRWLTWEIQRALRGHPVESWPDEPAMVAGTVALACLAGLPLTGQLRDLIGKGESLDRSPWHAGQVLAVLGRAAPDRVWDRCLRSLSEQPWAPWTAMGAHRRGDGEAAARTASVLEGSIRRVSPHRGGAALGDVPEIALTAVTIEALGELSWSSSRTAITHARRFLERWQFAEHSTPAALDPALADGAFPISPVMSFARCDVTGHALLALLHHARRGPGAR
jgi:AMMECR1 domain-containing protein